MGQQPNAVITNQSTFKRVVPFSRKNTQVAATIRMMLNQPQGPVEQALWNQFFRDEQLTGGGRRRRARKPPACGKLSFDACRERDDCGAYWAGKCRTQRWKGPACKKRPTEEFCLGLPNEKGCKWVVDSKYREGGCENRRYKLKIDPHPVVTRLAKSFKAIKKAVLHNIAQNPFDTSPIPDEFKLQDELNKIKIEEDAIGIEAAFCALHTLSVDRFLMRAPSRSQEGPQCSKAKVSDMTQFVAKLLDPSPSLVSSSSLYNERNHDFAISPIKFQKYSDDAEEYRKNEQYEDNSDESLHYYMINYVGIYHYITTVPFPRVSGNWYENEFAVSMYHSEKEGARFLVMKESFFEKVQAFMDDDSKYIFRVLLGTVWIKIKPCKYYRHQ